MVRGIALFTAAALFIGCNSVDMKGLIVPTSDVVDSRFEQSMTMNQNKALASLETEESYTFYVCTDPHIGDTNINLREFSTLLRNDATADFGIVLGDCTDKRNAFQNYVDAISLVEGEQHTNKPIFSLIGNHDLFFRGWDEYAKLLGPSVYWFEVECGASRDLFITLDSASGTLGKKQMKWLKEFLATERAKYRHCVVLTHTNLFYTDNTQQGSGNMALEETALLADLFSRNKVTLCLQGHDHFREDLMLDGVRYTIVGSIRDEAEAPEYLVITMSNSGAEYRWEYL